MIQELGFTCTAPNDIATKQEISAFLKIPTNTLNSYRYKHWCDIKFTVTEIGSEELAHKDSQGRLA